jgi:hypothetical protein
VSRATRYAWLSATALAVLTSALALARLKNGYVLALSSNSRLVYLTAHRFGITAATMDGTYPATLQVRVLQMPQEYVEDEQRAVYETRTKLPGLWYATRVVGANTSVTNLQAELHLPYWFFTLPLVCMIASWYWRLCRRSRRVERGLCGECGYILTGITSERCPECGTPVFATDQRSFQAESISDSVQSSAK